MPDEFPPLAALPQLTLHPSVNPEDLDATKIVNDWFLSFTEALSEKQSEDIQACFLDKESWWRDFVSFSWDIACHNGAKTICQYLTSSTTEFSEPKTDQLGALQPHLEDTGGLRFIQSGFSFKTIFGTGRGVLRLANVGPEQWKAWTVFTTLENLVGSAEIPSSASSRGLPPSISTDGDMQVLIVGAGEPYVTGLSKREPKLTLNLTNRPIWTCACCSSAKPRPEIPARGQSVSSWGVLAS